MAKGAPPRCPPKIEFREKANVKMARWTDVWKDADRLAAMDVIDFTIEKLLAGGLTAYTFSV